LAKGRVGVEFDKNRPGNRKVVQWTEIRHIFKVEVCTEFETVTSAMDERLDENGNVG